LKNNRKGQKTDRGKDMMGQLSAPRRTRNTEKGNGREEGLRKSGRSKGREGKELTKGEKSGEGL